VKEKFIRNIYYCRNYYLDFYSTLNPEVRRKFNRTLQLISEIERVPEKYFSHITGS
jgi:predicted translin family RNA/ssDNA-binding protein